jgi:hypothetical protein
MRLAVARFTASSPYSTRRQLGGSDTSRPTRGTSVPRTRALTRFVPSFAGSSHTKGAATAAARSFPGKLRTAVAAPVRPCSRTGHATNDESSPKPSEPMAACFSALPSTSGIGVASSLRPLVWRSSAIQGEHPRFTGYTFSRNSPSQDKYSCHRRTARRRPLLTALRDLGEREIPDSDSPHLYTSWRGDCRPNRLYLLVRDQEAASLKAGKLERSHQRRYRSRRVTVSARTASICRLWLELDGLSVRTLGATHSC